MRICSRCFRELPDEMFYHEKGQCRECRSEIRIFNLRKAQLQMKKNAKRFEPSTDVLRLAKSVLENASAVLEKELQRRENEIWKNIQKEIKND